LFFVYLFERVVDDFALALLKLEYPLVRKTARFLRRARGFSDPSPSIEEGSLPF